MRKQAITAVVLGACALLLAHDPAFAQDPFARATVAANTIFTGLSRISLVIGAIGVVAALLLGYFKTLDWKKVITGVVVSFAIALTGPIIDWLANLGGSLGQVPVQSQGGSGR